MKYSNTLSPRAIRTSELFSVTRDPVANAANLSALLFNELSSVNWVGLYFLRGDELVLGPFQGKPACVIIPLGKGVCGTAAASGKTQRVADVHAFPGHIACDIESRSEIVLPLKKDGKLLGVLDLEGLWTRYADPEPLLAEIAQLDNEQATARLQEVYAEPIQEDLIAQRIGEIRAGGVTVAAALSPQRTAQLHKAVVDAGVDLFVIRGTTVSAEHVSGRAEPLNLKQFIYELDVPVIVGGCATYQAALHLMRTGAAGVLVGFGGGTAHTTRSVLGVAVPMATAIADVAAARRDYLDESGGRYVHVHDAYAVAHLVIGRRREQRVIDAGGEQQRGRGGGPGQHGARQAAEACRVGKLVQVDHAIFLGSSRARLLDCLAQRSRRRPWRQRQRTEQKTAEY